jgi:hypothetical protein
LEKTAIISKKLPKIVRGCRCAVVGGVDGLMATIAAFWPPHKQRAALGLTIRLRGPREAVVSASATMCSGKIRRI